jgi:hypothetical protein
MKYVTQSISKSGMAEVKGAGGRNPYFGRIEGTTGRHLQTQIFRPCAIPANNLTENIHNPAFVILYYRYV